MVVVTAIIVFLASINDDPPSSNYCEESNEFSSAYHTVGDHHYEIPRTSAFSKSPSPFNPTYSKSTEAPSRTSFAMLSLPTTTAYPNQEKGIQFAHNTDNTIRKNEPQDSNHFGVVAQAYEVPTQSMNRDKKSGINRTPAYPSLQKPHFTVSTSHCCH